LLNAQASDARSQLGARVRSGCIVSTPQAVRAGTLSQLHLSLPPRAAGAIGGSEFARRTSGLTSADRDRAVVAELERGNMPSFLGQLTPVTLTTRASTGQAVAATIWVTPDYMAIGSDDDFLYVPLTYYSATAIADRFGAVLPTARMVDAIYEQSAHHLTPAPLPAGPGRVSPTSTCRSTSGGSTEQRSGSAPWEAHLRVLRKDLVLSNRLYQFPNRVAHLRLAGAPGRSHSAPEHRPRGPLCRLPATACAWSAPPSSSTADPPRSTTRFQDSHVAPALSGRGRDADPWRLMHATR
jgi:hypothetical protein